MENPTQQSGDHVPPFGLEVPQDQKHLQGKIHDLQIFASDFPYAHIGIAVAFLIVKCFLS